jgi:hypothetical protein
MYKIEKKDYGVHLTFGGFMDSPEMEKWVEESKSFLETLSPKFGVFVDMRELKPLPEGSQAIMQIGQKLYKLKGMQRSVVILDNAITTLQFKRIAKDTGIYEWERYIDASATDNWQEIGEKWIKDATDPDV